MMTERQRQFREQYMLEVSPLYNGLIHVAVMFIVGIAGVWYCFGQLDNPTWEWLLIAPVFIAGNFVEWVMHKYVMHRKIDVFALRSIYDRHTRNHHQYFTDNDATIDSVREFRIVFFPWRVLTVLGVSGIPLGFIAAWMFNPNAGYILYMTMIGHYLLYEIFHLCCHVRENWFVRNMPFINTIRRHHTAHHNFGIMMHKNMNLTFPIADWVMGTSDLNRGLLGTILNGYDESHIKPELVPIVRKFRDGGVQDTKVTLDGPQLDESEARALA